MNGPLGVSLVAVTVIGIFVLIGLFTMLSAVFGMGTAEGDPKAELNKLVAINKEKMQDFQDRFNGRSVFYKPSPWPAVPVARRDDGPAPPPPPPPPPEGPPKVYDGPGIWYAMTDIVRFKARTANDKPIDIHVGEEKNGVRLISTSLPWTVRVGYKGGEYDVNVWERKGDSFLLAQAPAIEIIPGLIEVPPARPKVEAPKAADGPVEAIASVEKPENAAAAGNARPPRREARPNTQPPSRGADRPRTQSPSESRGRGRNVQPEEDGEDPEPNDPETEEDAEVEKEAEADGVQGDNPDEAAEDEAESAPQGPRRRQPPPPAPPSPSAE